MGTDVPARLLIVETDGTLAATLGTPEGFEPHAVDDPCAAATSTVTERSDAMELGSFTDVRELQCRLKERGVELVREADESTTGPASFVAVDPDGNPIFVDQHV